MTAAPWQGAPADIRYEAMHVSESPACVFESCTQRKQAVQSIMPLAVCMPNGDGIDMIHVHAMCLHAARHLALAVMHITS